MHNSRCALRQCSPTAPGLAVLLSGGSRGFSIKPITHPHPGPPLEGKGAPLPCASCKDICGYRTWNRHPLPLCAASGWQANWGVSAAPCSSSVAACVLCKLLGRVAQTPNSPAKPKEPEGRRSGAAFLWLTFFGRTKKVTCLPGGPGTNKFMHVVHSTSCFSRARSSAGSCKRVPGSGKAGA